MAESSRFKRDGDDSSEQGSISEGNTANNLSSALKPTPSPAGLTLLHTLKGHTSVVYNMAWSPDGKWLASGSADRTVRVWDPNTGKLLRTLEGHTFSIHALAWSPNGKWLASGSGDGTVRVWDPTTGSILHTLANHEGDFSSVAWSPDGKWLAFGSYDTPVEVCDSTTGKLTLVGQTKRTSSVAWSPDGKWLAAGTRGGTVGIWDPITGMLHRGTVEVWDPITGRLLHTLKGQTGLADLVAWSPDGKWLASSSSDTPVMVWDPITGRLLHTLEGQTKRIRSVAWSPDGKWLASSSFATLQPSKFSLLAMTDVHIWYSETWEPLVVLTDLRGENRVAWHPYLPMMVTAGQREKDLFVWHLDPEQLLQAAPSPDTVHYTNAKVVLVGDSGVGKSGLALVLTQQPFVPTDSTHGRHVWLLNQQGSRSRATREVLLWDLAGQRDYRLIHQLHLHEATVALIVFDAARDTDPLAGIRYWHRALRQAQQASGLAPLPLTIFLVAARIDRGGGSVSRTRIEALLKELGCAGYIETSAKDGRGIAELGQTIRSAIDWSRLPSVTSTRLLQSMKTFVLHEQQAGRLLRAVDDLYDAFLRTDSGPPRQDVFRQQFEAALGRMEAQGAIRQLGFGQLILLQPELLDAYASALLIAVKQEPDGLGSIAEVRVQQGDFSVPVEDRLPNSTQEQLLLIAMIDELVRHQLVLRESGFLLFPSQSTREHPEQNTLAEKSFVTFTFAGPVLSIYTTLVVRLAQSGIFQKRDFWQRVVTYTTRLGGTYGLLLSPQGEERADLGLFFDEAAREEMRFHFEDFVHAHLQQHASTSLQRRRRFACSTCGFVVTEQLVQLLSQQRSSQCACPVCHATISLLDGAERLDTAPPSLVKAMEQAADNQRDKESALSILQGKIATQDFDVFLCYHGQDRGAVKQIGEQLKHSGILPWLDEWELRPGLPWQRLLEQQITDIKAAAVFVGKSGIGPWQQQELDAFLREFVQRGCPVIPVLLPDAPQEPALPVFLRAMTWVDFRSQDPDPMQRLLWGITGKREMSEERQRR